MPELPEVESCRFHLEKICLNGIITNVEVKEQGHHPRHGLFDDIIFENLSIDGMTTPQTYVHALKDKRITGVHRKGKHMWISLGLNGDIKTEDDNKKSKTKKKSSNDGTSTKSLLFDACLLHFGMTGSLVIKDHFNPVYRSFRVDKEDWPPRFTKLELTISANGVEHQVCFVDPRRLGSICLRNDPWNSSPISSLAVDITVEDIPSPCQILEKLSNRSRPIKAILLDQEFLFSGVGNWIADEVLYQAGIHPEVKGQDLSLEKITLMTQKLHDILTVAMNCLNKNENYPPEWLFNFRWEKHKKSELRGLSMPDGNSIVFIDVGGRTSAVVPAVQKKSSSTKNTSG